MHAQAVGRCHSCAHRWQLCNIPRRLRDAVSAALLQDIDAFWGGIAKETKPICETQIPYLEDAIAWGTKACFRWVTTAGAPPLPACSVCR